MARPTWHGVPLPVEPTSSPRPKATSNRWWKLALAVSFVLMLVCAWGWS